MINLNRLGWLVLVALIGSPLAARSAAAQAAAPGADKARRCCRAEMLPLSLARCKGNAKGALDSVGTKWTAAEIASGLPRRPK